MNEDAQKILEKVLVLFKRYGIKSISMDDIAREMRVSKKTLYQNFTDKEDLVNKFITYEIENRTCDMTKLMDSKMNSIEEILHVNNFFNDDTRKYNPTLEFDLKKFYPATYERVKKIRREGIVKHIYDNIEKGKQEGFYRTEIDSMIIAKLYALRIEAIVESDIFTHEELISNKILNEIFLYHLHAICNAKGLKFLQKKINELNITKNE